MIIGELPRHKGGVNSAVTRLRSYSDKSECELRTGRRIRFGLPAMLRKAMRAGTEGSPRLDRGLPEAYFSKNIYNKRNHRGVAQR